MNRAFNVTRARHAEQDVFVADPLEFLRDFVADAPARSLSRRRQQTSGTTLESDQQGSERNG